MQRNLLLVHLCLYLAHKWHLQNAFRRPYTVFQLYVTVSHLAHVPVP